MNLRTLFLLFFLLVFSGLPVFSQEDEMKLDSTLLGHGAYLMIDSIVITAKRKGFDVESFIQHIMNDESFYFAFKNLRRNAYHFDMHNVYYDKKERVKAGYFGTHKQTIVDTCRTMETLHEYASGNFFKEGKNYNYYTSRLFDRSFLTRGVKCFSHSDTIMNFDSKNSSQLESQISQLKKVIFSPGKATGLPILGDKMAIFKEKMRKYYNYSLVVEPYKSFEECYVFKVELKEFYTKKKKGKTIVKYMYTYFDKSTLQIVGREYRVKHGLPLYSFDMTLDIALTKIDNKYIPKSIFIEGFWDLLFKKPEKFKAEFYFYSFR